MPDGHEPFETKNSHPDGLQTASSPLADGTPKSSRTIALRNRLGFRRNDGSPRSGSRKASAQEKARRDNHSGSVRSGGFLLDSPGSRSVGSRAQDDAKAVSHGLGDTSGRENTPSRREEHLRTSSSTMVENGEGSSRGSTPYGTMRGRNPMLGDPESSFQAPTPPRPGTNPAEIVGLALSLSDNRKRRSQLGTSTAGVNIGPLAASHLMPRVHDMADQEAHEEAAAAPMEALDLGDQQDHGSSQQMGHSSSSAMAPQPHSRRLASGTQREQLSGLLPLSTAAFGPAAGFVPSQATLKRVEKTKAALELAYHHRRVLQHLPELPRSKAAAQRPNTGRLEQRGRAYNPLQYIRNRRVRQREGCPLNPSKAGWEDIGRVQAWVNAVAEETRRDPRRTSSIKELPPLPPSSQDIYSSFTAPGPSHADGSSAPRLRADWSASPAEMLADAHWMHESENRFMMLDRDGSRLFEIHSQHKSQHGRNGSLARPTADRGGKYSFELVRPGTQDSKQWKEMTPERGRREDDQAGAKQTEARLSTSTDRKGRLIRNVLRSASPSVRSDISDIVGQPLTRGMQSMDEKDLQDVLLLRQQLRMMSRGAASGQSDTQTSQNVANGETKEKTETREERFYDATSQYSTDEADRFGQLGSTKRQEHAKHLVRSVESRALDSGMSSDQEPEPLPRRILQIPDVSVEGDPSAKSHSQLLDSALPAHSPDRGKGAQRQQLISDDLKNSYKASTGEPILQSPPRTGSDVNFSPSRVSRRQLKGRRKDKQLPTGGSPRSGRDQEDSDSRSRGFIRGSKLSGLVSAPANKVSDLLWRRGDSEHHPQPSSSASMDPDDRDEVFHLDNNEQTSIQVKPTADDDSSPESRSREQGYHLSNLPVFRSPFKGSSNTSFENHSDHISRQQQELRYRRSQSRFDKLAPPSLDLRSVSRSPSRGPSTQPESREISGEYQQPPGTGRRSAVVAGSAGEQPDKGLQDVSQGLGELHLKRWRPDSYMYAIARPDVVEATGKVSKMDIARLETLMKSCAVQSNEMLRWVGGEAVPNTMKNGGESSTDCLNRATGIEVGKSLLGSINQNFVATRDAMSHFSEDTVNEIHKQLQSLHTELSDNLAGAVRNAERAADDLGSQLALDCTLEVKRLNETMDIILRRRRRRSRWLRRTGFSLLEWAVLALMWWVWLLVVIIRIVKGTVKGLYWGTRWLLWL